MDYNVTYRKRSGKYQCIISYKTSTGWKQKSKQGFERQKDAKPWVDTALKELRKKAKNDKGFTFEKLVDKYKKDFKRYRAAGTMNNVDVAVSNFSALKNMLLEDIKTEHVQKCIDAMNDKGLKYTTINMYTIKLKTLFNVAIKKYKLLNENPANNTTLPGDKKIKNKKVKALTLKELDILITNSPKIKRRCIILLAAKCGLRCGEIAGLTWADVDFENGMIDINKQWKELEDGSYGFGDLKSSNGYRVVPVPPDVLNTLKELQEDSYTDRILPYKSSASLSANMIVFFNRYGFDITLHYLRHTYATTLLSKGLDYHTVAQLMGDTVQEIIRTYSHVTSDMMTRAKEMVNTVF